MRAFAKRLMAYNSSGGASSAANSPAAVRVCDRLHQHLAMFMGNGGFRALLSRALTLASAEVPWLRDVRVDPDASLDGLEELGARLGPDELLAGRVVLVAHLLALLIAFIGEDLTVRLVREVWPDVPVDGLTLRSQGNYENEE